jgi:hypothetical protein
LAGVAFGVGNSRRDFGGDRHEAKYTRLIGCKYHIWEAVC